MALEATGTALGEFSNKKLDHVEKLIKQTTDQLWVTVERRFGELMGRPDALRQMRGRGRRISSLPTSVTPILILLTFQTRCRDAALLDLYATGGSGRG